MQTNILNNDPYGITKQQAKKQQDQEKVQAGMEVAGSLRNGEGPLFLQKMEEVFIARVKGLIKKDEGCLALMAAIAHIGADLMIAEKVVKDELKTLSKVQEE